MFRPRQQQMLLAVLLLAALPCAGQFRDPLPVPDVAGYRTLKCDFHMHTVFSDGEVWPTTRVNEAWREGLDAISITDHAGYNPNKQDVPPELTRPFAIASPLAQRLGIILVPGVEVMEGNTHFNILFVSDPNAFFGLSMVEALRVGHAHDGFIFWNHPGWRQPADWFPNVAALYEERAFHGVELVNGLTYCPQAFPWIQERKLAILANSDLHATTLPAYADRKRPVTLVFARTGDLAGIREALFARRTAAWMGGELWGSEELLQGLFEGAVWAGNNSVAFSPGSAQATLKLNNRSAIRFQLRPVKAPGWLSAGGAELRPESGVGIMLQINKQAPTGDHSADLEFEVVNLHVAPGRNLMITVPLRIRVP